MNSIDRGTNKLTIVFWVCRHN